MHPAQFLPSDSVVQRYLRLPDLCRRYGVCRSTVYNWIDRIGLPPGRPLGLRAVVWLIDDLESWEATRLAHSGGDLA